MNINGLLYWGLISILIGLYAGVVESGETELLKVNEIVRDQFEFSSLHDKANSAHIHLKAGRPVLAEGVFDDIIRLAKLPEDSNLLASCLLNRGIAKVEQQQLDMAHLDFLEAAKMATQFRHSDVAVKAYLNAAQNQMSLGHTLEARSLLNSSNEWLQSLKPVLEKAELELALGHLWQLNQLSVLSTDERSSELAYRILNDAIEISQSLHRDDLLSYGYGYLAAVYLDNGRFDDALRLTERAEFLAQAIQRTDLLFRWQWQMGRILARQNKRLEAIANYQRAIDILQPIRSEFRGQSNTVTRLDFDDLYTELADLLLQNANLPETDLMMIRELIEHGRTEELEAYFRDDCITAWMNKTASIDRLDKHTAALYPIMLGDRLELILSMPEGLKRFTIFKKRDDIRQLVGKFRATLENRSTSEFLPYAKAIYQLLIEPVLANLKNAQIDTLVFIPDATFRTIPLSTLHDGKEFLIRNFAIATSPGLTLTEPQPIQPDSSLALIAGLSESHQGFQALPNVKDEIRLIAEQFPAMIIENQAFTMDTIRQQLLDNPYRIVHIASHGQFDRHLENTFVLASDGKITLDVLGKMMGVNRFRNEPVELLTLSACRTAAGDEQAALGLAGVAIKAGARSALASLWFINDSASASLVANFYKQLKTAGFSKAKALQNAQLSLLKDERYEHPAYWAPFLLIGNWL